MKFRSIIGCFIIIAFFSGCFKHNGEESDIPLYSIDENIIYPPDSFKIIMPLNTNTSVRTFFRDSVSSVWKINKLNFQSSTIWMLRTSSPDTLEYISADTLGLEKNVQYEIYGRSNQDEDRKVYLKFIRLAEDYETFPNKL